MYAAFGPPAPEHLNDGGVELMGATGFEPVTGWSCLPGGFRARRRGRAGDSKGGDHL